MAPIRVGLVGLSTESAGLGTGKWAVSAHLPSYLASPHYELVAVCNSTAESARRSIEFHGLPPTTRAYGKPEDLADDPDVDLVVISVLVSRHHMLAMPALKAKKQVFVEWPLGQNTAEAVEMEALVREQGHKGVVGLQMRADPFILKAKQLIDSGAIGKVRSTVVLFCPNFMPAGTWIAGPAEYYLSFENGANAYHVGFGHFLDSFTFVLGDFVNTQSIVKNTMPEVKLIDPTTGEIVNPAYHKSVPDHVLVQGELESGALASLTMRTTRRDVDGQSLRWVISGSEGELELTIPGPLLQTGAEPRVIRMTVGDDGVTEEVDWKAAGEPEYVTSVPSPGTNTARVLEAYVTGAPGAADFADAVKLHKLLDKIAADANYP